MQVDGMKMTAEFTVEITLLNSLDKIFVLLDAKMFVGFAGSAPICSCRAKLVVEFVL